MDIEELRNCLVGAVNGIYGPVLDKFGAAITKKNLKDASEEEKESFVRRLKEEQLKKFDGRFSHLTDRVIVDYKFIREHDEIMSSFKSAEELRQGSKVADNHIQSVGNERSNLQEKTDECINKIEEDCEAILAYKLINHH